MANIDTDDSFSVVSPPAKTKKAPTKPRAAGTTKAAPKKKAEPLKARKSNEADENDSQDIDMLPVNGNAKAESSLQPSAVNSSRSTPAPGTKKSATETYQKLSQLEHVLLRPDTYIGSVEHHQEDMWVFDPAHQRMAYRKISYIPGFYKIFDEILVNAADNKVRDTSMDTIKVTIDKEEGSISVWNNGRGIPIEIHEKEGIYIPELIFGNLLTSSNYDDAEDKVTGGRNGYGAKLANIYSTEFVVETADSNSGQKYRQVFSNNMGTRGKAKITKATGAKDFTCITFKPDFKRFNLEKIDDDMEALMMKRVYDMAGTVRDCKVFLNGERLKIKGFKQYVEMYINAINELGGGTEPKEEDMGADMLGASGKPKQSIIYESITDRGKVWEVAFAVSDGEARQVSFVNNIATIKGGKHVDLVENQIVTRISEYVTKTKKNTVKLAAIRSQLWIFVNCQIVNPTFDSQTKETMTLKASAFGSKWTLTDALAKKIMSSGVVDNVMLHAKMQQERALKKTDGHKRNRITGITKLEDANNAGTRKARDCTLILTEGDSAKALAVAGLTEVGRDNFGVFPLRGKLLNVREASHDQIMKNAEITNIKTIMGLKHGTVYESTDSLRYGRLMIMTDQDHDGSHIKGLIINFLDHFFPSLLKQPQFLVEFITPIVKCKKGSAEKTFFTMPEYEVWKEENAQGKGWTIKYYKGLGTSDAQDGKRYFRAMNTHMLPFQTTQPGDRDLIDLAFNKKKADDRKEWLRQFKPGTYLDHSISEVPLADFINKELILFSMADNARSIPSVVDGLKPGQRKVMFSCFKRKLKGEIKVGSLSGYVLEHAAYHHGETSLQMTIVNLAQDFVGANNVNILLPNGQFGTRMMGGKDAASARYIFTNVADITRTLFHPADDGLLNYLNEDGQSIEPEWYIPCVPLLLLNGSEGIGTGWSSYIPNYNPRDVVENLKRRMNGEEYIQMHPWYRGFTGQIIPEDANRNRYKCLGTVTQKDEKTWEITELPIKTWTSTYKEGLEERVIGTEKVPATIKEYKEYHTDTTVHFVVELNPKGQAEVAEKGAEAFFKLSSQISTTNMVLFDHQGKIKKYTSPEEILDDFYLLRFEYYSKRKDYLVDELKLQYERLSNQARFVQMIINKELQINNRKRKELVNELRAKDFRPFPRQIKPKVAADVDADEEEEEDIGTDSDYDYLLSMAIWNLTKEKVDKLLAQRDEKEKELETLLRRTPQNLWGEDLHKFEEQWQALLDEDARRLADVGNNKRGRKSGGGAGSKAKATKPRKQVKKDEDAMILDGDDDFVPAEKKPAVKKSSGVKREASEAVGDEVKSTGGMSASSSKNGLKKLKQSKLVANDSEDEDAYLMPSKPSKSKLPVKDEDDDILDTPPKKSQPARQRKTTAKYSKVISDDEDDDDNDDDDEEYNDDDD
ncbi:hypothetical protein L7F22_054028 [Adiantum nelumboides]|nr:hypothetical protein [Adiantum nelumboides]